MNQLAHIPNDDESKMASLRRRPSKDKDIVGWFRPDGRCKKHPKHRQSPGVCSLCLRDKLAQLPSASTSRKKTLSATAASSCSSSVSSLSSYYSSSSASSCASPMHPFPFATKGKSSSSSVSIFLMSSRDGLMKSRSMAVVPRRRRRRRKDGEGGTVDDDHNKKSAKKSGFWFKLLHPKSKRSMEEKDTKLVHSRSVRETVSVASDSDKNEHLFVSN